MNYDALGEVVITGAIIEDANLTANTSTINDEDGMRNATLTYTWTRVSCDDGSKDGPIQDAADDKTTHTLTQEDVNCEIQVTAEFTDDCNTTETLSSGNTNKVSNTNDDPTGSERNVLCSLLSTMYNVQ